MKVGDYVRTKYGIAKIEEIKPDDKHKTIWYTVDKAQYHCFLVQPKDIIKSSSNLIDLIEVGDYVNGYKITDFTEIDKYNDEKILYADLSSDYISIYENEIKSIVTKEQFESMEYKVVE